MVSQQNIIQSTAMPSQKLLAYPSGSTSPGNAALKLQQEQTSKQMALIGKSGGSKKRKYRVKGGSTQPRVLVPPVPAGTVNSSATSENYAELTKLAQQQSTQSAYDNTKTQAQVASVAGQQQALYKGGSRRRYKKGGYSPIWGCLSGGTKRNKKRTKRIKRTKQTQRTRKCRKNKRY